MAHYQTFSSVDRCCHFPLKSRVQFLREFLTTPAVIGAVAPSSEHLARTMLAGLDLRNARAVLEYGPGTGIVTDHIRRENSTNTSMVAIEINPTIEALYKQRTPTVMYFMST